jgi:hypothetical protein
MAIMMGLDQHRAQITAEWIDTVERRSNDSAAAHCLGLPD